jgi:hypothetical protein
MSNSTVREWHRIQALILGFPLFGESLEARAGQLVADAYTNAEDTCGGEPYDEERFAEIALSSLECLLGCSSDEGLMLWARLNRIEW